MPEDQRFLGVTPPAAAGPMALTMFTGQEALSRLFHYRLELISDNPSVAAKDVVGTAITWDVQDPDVGGVRYFNGIISRWVAGPAYKGGKRTYWADVVPQLWFLTRTANCRIFQNKSALDIIKIVLQDFGISNLSVKTTGTYAAREYCVQYRETAFNFISRLMEYEGIFYFFIHEDGKHTLVLADANSVFQDCQANPVGYGSGGSSAFSQVHSWEHQYEYRSGQISQTDYNFKTPSTSLLANVKSVLQLQNISKYELFDYPGGYMKKDDGNSELKVRIQEEEAAFESISAAGNCESFYAGGKFTLHEHDIDSEKGDYVVASIQHNARDTSYERDASGSFYENTFTCIPAKTPFRPARVTPTPIVQGAQTAVIVGKAGEEIYCDEYGRVKVQFFWDRMGKKDENSSCWVRVSQNWAGKNWGAIFTPRIGQEVVVSFLEGDPDRPLITGRVYNAEQAVPYALPANQTISTIKTRSSKEGTPENFNEISFEDKKGSELLTIHAEKDQSIGVEHDEAHWVGHDRTKTIDHDETTHVKHDRTETVDNNETITIHANRAETVDKDETITIHGNRTETVDKDENITVSGNRTESVSKDESITINGSRTESVSKDESITINGGRTVSISKDESISINGGQTISIGKALTINAADQITLATGVSSIVLKKDGTISIQGKSISIVGTQSIESVAQNIKSTADVGNKIAGTMVNLEANGIATVKGSLVKVN